MPFSSIFGHEDILKRLQVAFASDHIPSAYLFTGPEGIGKGVTAKTLAQMLNCTTHNNCGFCDSCRMFLSDSHPDFIIVRPDGKNIKISQIKALIQNLSLKPTYAKKRVVVIKQANQFNLESANAFLKVLEEPPLDTLLVLTASDESQLIDTLLSRCQKMSFAPLTAIQVEAILKKDFTLEDDCHGLILDYCEGRLRSDFIDKASKLLSLRGQALHMLQDMRVENLETFTIQIKSALDQNLEFYLLEFLGHLLKDIRLYQEGMEQYISNQDLLTEIKDLSPRFSHIGLEEAFSACLETEKGLATFAAKPLALEALIVQIKNSLAR
ncbi:MAG: DNA polymerase III subunit delta' [SAR324 cluster bacterium]|nr:DNA polymerase III subunit delta' [SAR324 cluster bacterium]